MAEKTHFEGVRLIWRRFAGLADEMNVAGERNFCIVIPDERIDELIEAGWNVKTFVPKTEVDPDAQPFSFLKVKVGGYCTVWLINSRGRRQLSTDNYGLIDRSEIVNADIAVVPSYWNFNGKNGKACYLSEAYITVPDSPFEDKYSDMPIVGG